MDLFYVEPSMAYAGSYTDYMATGSLPNRGRAVSHTSGSVEVYSTTRLSDFWYFTSQSNPNISNCSVRFAQLTSPNERYYDTLVPSIHSIVLRDGGQLVHSRVRDLLGGAFSTFRYVFGGVVNGQMVSVTASLNPAGDFREQVSDNVWLKAFPFENKYINIGRVDALNINISNAKFHVSGICYGYGESIYGGTNSLLTPTEVITADNPSSPFWGGSSSTIIFGALTAGIIYVLSGSPSGTLSYLNRTEVMIGDIFGNVTIATPPVFSNLPTKDVTVTNGTKPTSVNNKDMAKHLYGFGDWPIYNSPEPLNDGFVFSPSSINRYGVGSVSRGWKYGLLNAFPVYSKAIFRRERYGHFRDMLEQRLYSKFFDTVGIDSFGNRNSPIGSREGIIKVTFVSGSSAYVTASNSTTLNSRDSGMYNTEYTSGQPYYDLDRI